MLNYNTASPSRKATFKGEILNMHIAITAKRPKSTGNKWTIAYTYVDEDATKAAAAAELQSANCRRANSGYEYRTFVGQVTHEVIPPEETVELRPIPAKEDPTFAKNY